MNKVRTEIYLTKRQRNTLQVLAKREGISMAEQVRRAIDAYLVEKESQHKAKVERTTI